MRVTASIREAFEAWEKELENHHGRYKFTELADLTGEADHHRQLSTYYINEFLKFVNQRENIHISRSASGGTGGRKYFVRARTDYTYPEYRERLPDEAEDVFRVLVSQGKSPSTAAATIQYLIGDKSQVDTANEYGVTAASIRNNVGMVEKLFERDDVEISSLELSN